MNIVNDVLVNTLFPDTDFVQTLSMNSVVPKYVENQEKGNPSVCKNCAEAPFKDLHIYGRSEQMTTTGAQLLDLDAINLATGGGATIKRLDDGGFLVDGTPKKAYEQYTKKIAINLAPGTYFVSGGRYEDGCAVAQINILNADGTKKYKSNASFDVLGTEQGITLVIQSISEKPINNYKIYPMINSGSVALPFEPYTGGKPSPSPDYPQEIQSAGDDGNLTVKVTGRNILDMRNSKESVANSGVTYTRNADYSFNRTGTATESIGNVWMAGGYFVKPKADLSNVLCVLLKGVKYSIKDCVLLTVSPAGNALAARNENFVPTQDMYITGVRNENFIVGETYNDIVYPAVYVGEKALQYEPYREQLLTIPTPNGLPGIPVTAGGNYTDQSGQQWICDEVDLGRGVYVQRVDKGAFDATKALTEQSVILATPIETPLTTAEIAAYKSLRTYRGTTIVEAEDKAGIFVKYNMPMPKLSKNGALRRWFKRHPII